MNPWQIQLQNGNLPAGPLQRAGKLRVPCRRYCGTIAQGGSASLHRTVAGGLLPAKLDEKAARQSKTTLRRSMRKQRTPTQAGRRLKAN